jgi:OOP family OmpA-OmpF porin
MKNTAAMLGLAVACASVLAQAQDVAPAEQERYFALLGSSLTGPDDRRNPRVDGALGAELRFGAHPAAGGWGYELRAFQESLEKTADGDKGNRGGLGVDAIYRLPRLLHLTAYGLGGMALAYSDALPGRDWVAPVVNAGAGVETGPLLNLMGHALKFRVEGRYSYEDNRDEYTTPTQVDRANYVETRVYAGFSLAFAKAEPPPEVRVIESVPEPEPVVAPLAEPVAPGDTDGDGIPDDRDRCAASELGQPVDDEGCTIPKVLKSD